MEALKNLLRLNSFKRKITVVMFALVILTVIFLTGVSFNLISSVIEEKNRNEESGNITMLRSDMINEFNSFQKQIAKMIQLDSVQSAVNLSDSTSTDENSLKKQISADMQPIFYNSEHNDRAKTIFVGLYCVNNFSYTTAHYSWSNYLDSLPFNDYTSCVEYFNSSGYVTSSGIPKLKYCGIYTCTPSEDKNSEEDTILFYVQRLFNTYDYTYGGLLVSGIRITDLRSIFANTYTDGIMIDVNGIIIASAEKAKTGNTFEYHEELRKYFSNDEKTGLYNLETNNNKSDYSYARIVWNNILFTSPIRANNNFFSLSNSWLYLFLICIGLGVIYLFVILLSRVLAKPMIKLKQAVEKIPSDVDFPRSDCDDEILYLNNRFLELCTQIKESNKFIDGIKHILPLLQERFFEDLINFEEQATEKQLLFQMHMLKIDMPDKYFCISLFSLILSKLQYEDFELMLNLAKDNVSSSIYKFGIKNFSFIDNKYRIVCVVNLDNENSIEMNNAISSAKDSLVSDLGIKSIIGTGLPKDSIDLLFESHEEASVMLKSNAATAQEYTINRKKNPEVISQLCNYIKTNSYSDWSELLEEYFINIICLYPDNFPAALEFAFEYLSVLFLTCSELGLRVDELNDCFGLLSDMSDSETSFEIYQSLSKVTKKITTILFGKCKASNNPLVEKAKKFILSHLSDKNLSLNMVCCAINLSEVYFSKLFHDVSGIVFNEYLNTERTKMASRLLRETDMRIYEISNHTGYQNPRYFNYVFKRFTGLTPTEYRKNWINTIDNHA